MLLAGLLSRRSRYPQLPQEQLFADSRELSLCRLPPVCPCPVSYNRAWPNVTGGPGYRHPTLERISSLEKFLVPIVEGPTFYRERPSNQRCQLSYSCGPDQLRLPLPDRRWRTESPRRTADQGHSQRDQEGRGPGNRSCGRASRLRPIRRPTRRQPANGCPQIPEAH